MREFKNARISVFSLREKLCCANLTALKVWVSSRQEKWCINHAGSSDAMEKEVAKEIFLRSMETRGLSYVNFIGDAIADKYGDKYEDIQKRLGTGLREYKRKARSKTSDDGKTVGGTNRLADKVIDKIQNYHGKAIRNNAGDLEMMRNDIWG